MEKLSILYNLKDSNANDDTGTRMTNFNVERTPTQKKLSLSQGNECSPVYIPHTQETLEQLDVGWDWNSPKSKQHYKLPVQKRPSSHQSPKPIKRHVSNNQVGSYDKLKHELESFKDQLVKSRCNNKHGKSLFNNEDHLRKEEIKDLNDLFEDDSLEEEMILQSQKIEQLLTMEIKNDICDISVQNIVNSSSSTCTPSKCDLRKVKSANSLSNLYESQFIKKTVSNSKIQSSGQYSLQNYKTLTKDSESNIKDDSFDYALKLFSDKELVEDLVCDKSIINESVNIKPDEKLCNKVCTFEEIKHKKLTALAKLHSRRQDTNSTCTNSNIPLGKITDCQTNQTDEGSPIKCSPEEIEQKRLKALAKLAEKKKQAKIERNRREALKRLELNKKKKAMTSQTLCNK